MDEIEKKRRQRIGKKTMKKRRCTEYDDENSVDEEDYVKKEEDVLRNMTLEKHKELAQKYLNPDEMIYVVVGDAETQMEPLSELGLGEPELLDLK